MVDSYYVVLLRCHVCWDVVVFGVLVVCYGVLFGIWCLVGVVLVVRCGLCGMLLVC